MQLGILRSENSMKTTKKLTFLALIAVCAVAIIGCQPEPDTTVRVASVSLDKPALTMTVGDEETLIATIAPSNASNQNVVWSSTEPSVVAVAGGKVTAIAAGSGKITVTTQDGNKTATCTVTVNASQTDTVATPTATPASGEVADNTAITLTTTTAEAAIHYTQDGTEPTTASQVYSDTDKPVITTGKLTLKAIAVKSGMNNSAILTETYTIATVTPPEPTPPTASITNNNQTVTLAPDLEITLNGTATKGTNEIKSYEWTVKTTESGVTPVFTTGTSAVTKVTGIKKAGTYVFELKVKDTADLEGKATAMVAVNGYSATKTVTVSFPAFTSGSTTLSFAPTYSPAIAGGGFENGDVTYTLEDNMGHNNSNFPGGVVSVGLYQDSDMPIFTQIFKLNNVEVGRQKIKVIVSEFFEKTFDALLNADNNSVLSPQAIPSVNLHLVKEVTEILPPPVTKTVTVTFPAFVQYSPTLNLTPTYTPDGGWGAFSENDITFTLSSVNPVKDLSDCSNGNIPASKYAGNDYPTITQNFYYNGQEVGKGRVVVVVSLLFGGFSSLYQYNPTDGEDSDWTEIQAIPPVTLTLTKPGTW
jgi:hypothetical protein